MQRINGLIKSLVLGTLTISTRGTGAAIGAAALVALAGHARADVKAVEPYFVVVAKDNIPLKCSDGNIYYAVKMLKANEVLRVDGSGGGWLRVEYPAGAKAYVKADEGTFDDGAKTLKLNRPSKLMSANATGARPWWYLLEADVPAGVMFKDAEVVKSADGAVEGYLIPAPNAVRGYVREEATRAATADEAKGYKAMGMPTDAVAVRPATPPTPTTPTAETPKPIATAPIPASTATVPAAHPMKAPEAAPIAAETHKPTVQPPSPSVTAMPTTSETAPGASSSAPTITMSPTPAPGTAPAAPVATNPAPATTTMTPPAPSVPPAPPAATKRVEDVDTLRTMFDRVMQGQGDAAEINTVISEFNRTIDSLGNSDRDVSTRNSLRARLQALRLRQDVMDMSKRVAETDAQFSEKTRQTTIAIQDVEKQAIYTIVGRILPSTVYDGRRGLPLMYRVESGDASCTRTIGYVVPRDGVELLAKMGKMVGIVGEAKMDPALGLNIVAPKRVDSLEIVGGKFQVVTDKQTTTSTTTTGPNGTATLTTTTIVKTEGPAQTAPAAPDSKPVPVAQPNEQPDMNK